METLRGQRVWTLWLQESRGQRPVVRGSQTSLTEAHRFFDWVCSKVRDGVYPAKTGVLKLFGPERDCLAELDIETKNVQWYAPGAASSLHDGTRDDDNG